MRINRKMNWLPLLTVGLMAVLSPCLALAQIEKTDLTLTIVGDGYYNVMKTGEEKTILLEVGNGGNTQLTNIRLYADSPKGWTVEFNPALINDLDPGNSQLVKVLLKPAAEAGKREYNIPLIAQANETSGATSITARMESTSLLWVWVGIGIAVLLIAGAVAIFMRFGRE